MERRAFLLTDAEIIELFFERNENAVKEINNKYGRYCHSIAYKILHDPEDAEECVNETWYSTWESIPPTKPQRLKLFIAKIVRNISFDRYKSKNRKKRGSGELPQVLDELEECLSGNHDVEKDYIARELNETIQKFVYQLAEREANIFIRRYFFVDSLDEIAKRYGISSNHVGVILSRTRGKLKYVLEKEGYVL